jgi:long-chain acyl-CoA synthetase
MVVSGGVNLYPAEAENVLIGHAAVADVACIGIPHAEMGEQLRALVVMEPGTRATPDEILGYCRDHLSSYKCPRSIEFVTDLGRNTMGKVNKRTLRAPYWA